ncbi:MAG: PEP-CTERM sorting domain-containing protein [Pirellulales bacterium]|nr:PEP-CTERM sorting domain-containing protein [Pirellulales bacterium]
MNISKLVTIIAVFSAGQALAGPFTNLGIDQASPDIVAWAQGVVSFTPTPSGSLSAEGDAALGPPDASFAPLGDLDSSEIASGDLPGAITLDFGPLSLFDGPGWDLAVFENAGEFFTAPFIFGELAYVQVSSDGVVFAEFPNTSLNVESGQGTADTELVVPWGRNFAGLNTTNVQNLAGIHPQGTGTAFDLSDLTAEPLVTSGDVDLTNIRFLRLIDIPGSGDFLDSQGNPILDVWPTSGAGGLDLDAVGARYVVPEPTSTILMLFTVFYGLCARNRVRVLCRG